MEYDLITETIRVLFLQSLPVVLVLALVGFILSLINSASAIHEQSLSYGVRVVSLILVLYLTIPSTIKSIEEIALVAFK